MIQIVLPGIVTWASVVTSLSGLSKSVSAKKNARIAKIIENVYRSVASITSVSIGIFPVAGNASLEDCANIVKGMTSVQAAFAKD